jgi:hypothetical protein
MHRTPRLVPTAFLSFNSDDFQRAFFKKQNLSYCSPIVSEHPRNVSGVLSDIPRIGHDPLRLLLYNA